MGNLSLNRPVNLYKYLLLVKIGNTRLGKKEPWEITVPPIMVMIVVYAVITYSLGEKW